MQRCRKCSNKYVRKTSARAWLIHDGRIYRFEPLLPPTVRRRFATLVPDTNDICLVLVKVYASLVFHHAAAMQMCTYVRTWFENFFDLAAEVRGKFQKFKCNRYTGTYRVPASPQNGWRCRDFRRNMSEIKKLPGIIPGIVHPRVSYILKSCFL